MSKGLIKFLTANFGLSRRSPVAIRRSRDWVPFSAVYFWSGEIFNVHHFMFYYHNDYHHASSQIPVKNISLLRSAVSVRALSPCDVRPLLLFFCLLLFLLLRLVAETVQTPVFLISLM